MLNERKKKILQIIIEDYISSAEPVGSRTIARKYDLGSARQRSVMRCQTLSFWVIWNSRILQRDVFHLLRLIVLCRCPD